MIENNVKDEVSFWVVNAKLRSGNELDSDVKEILEKIGVKKKSFHNDDMVELIGPVKAIKALKKLIDSKIAK